MENPPLPPLPCLFCGYGMDRAVAGSVCPECGKNQGEFRAALSLRAAWSFLWLFIYGGIYVAIVGLAGTVGDSAHAVGGLVFAVFGLFLAAGAHLGLEAVFRGSENEVARWYARIAWNRGVVFLGLPVLAGHCGAVLVEWAYLRAGGVMHEYWSSEPLAVAIAGHVRTAVYASIFVAVVGWSAVVCLTPPASQRGIVRRYIVPLAVAFLLLTGLSVLGGLGLMALAAF